MGSIIPLLDDDLTLVQESISGRVQNWIRAPHLTPHLLKQKGGLGHGDPTDADEVALSALFQHDLRKTTLLVVGLSGVE